MPHHPDDSRYPHLHLVREEPNPQRRKQGFPPPPAPNRGSRTHFAVELRDRINDIESAVAQRPPLPPGIDPHLVFRVPLSPEASAQSIADHLQRIGIIVVSYESDNAIIAFQNDADLTQFREAISTYEQGPRVNPQTGDFFASTQWDLLEHIEVAEMRLWGRLDRIGTRLAHLIGDQAQSIHADQMYILDVELWNRGNDQLNRAAVQELRTIIETETRGGERLCDSFVGQLLCLARVAVLGQKLSAILDLDVVAEVEIPSQPTFDHRQVLRITEREFERPPLPELGSTSVCVLDSGIVSNHPLLASNVGHAVSLLPSSDSAADQNGHGTLVSGIAVFGDIRAWYEIGAFSSPITLFSARVLNSDNRFDDDSLIIHQMRRAIEFFINAPYACRVFNLSLGDSAAWLQNNSRQSIWAESLDILAREYNVVLVLSAGNHNRGWARNTGEAEEILSTYPDFLFQDASCGLCDPATAAIPITVGAIAHHVAPAIPTATRADDITISVAEALEPTPTTRIGPGINGAIKPEFVANGGNVSFRGMLNHRQVDEDPGLSVMSFSHEPTQRLFQFGIGTSLAAPHVSRTAAVLLDHLRQNLNEEPDANLVRAVLASAAEIPRPTNPRIETVHGTEGLSRVYGYGCIDEDVLLDSADRRVTLVAQSAIPLDTLAIYEVPSPLEFRTATGQKKVIVTLAFDPPVRRRRADYLGVKMDFALIRGKTVDEIVEAYRQLSAEESKAHKDGGTKPQGAFQSPYKCNLTPGPLSLQSSTLQRAEWNFSWEKSDYGETWFIVIRAHRTWAPVSFTDQRFAVTITLQAEEPRLYTLIQNRIQLRQRQRARQ